jgi:hypothetical protein
LVGSHEIQTNAANAKTCKKNSAGRFGRKAVDGVIASDGTHLTVNPDKVDPTLDEVGFYKIEEGRPLAEHYRLNSRFLAWCGENLYQGLDLATRIAGIRAHSVRIFTEILGRRDQTLIVFDIGTAEWALVLSFDDFLDTAFAVRMGTRSDDRLVKVIETDGTHFLAFYLKLQHILQSLHVLRSKFHRFLLT